MFQLLKIAAASLAGLALAAGVVWLAFFSEHLRFRQLRVVGNSRASEAALRHLADLPVGDALLALDLDAAVAGALRHPWVASATARRVFPDTVVLQVHEREVKALLLLDGLYLVDEGGVPFRKADAQDLDHPVITGIPAEIAQKHPDVARRLVADALALLDAAPGRAGVTARDVSEVRFDANSGYTLALRNGGEVRVGFDRDGALDRLDRLASRGVTLLTPLRIDLGSPRLAVVSPL
jgi:cell division septal protein FtsQ